MNGRLNVLVPRTGMLLLLALSAAVLAAGRPAAPAAAGKPASRPGSQPANAPGDSAAMVTESLLDGAIQFSRPTDWEQRTLKPTVAIYVSPNHKGAISIEVRPSDADVGPQAAGGMVRQLRENNKKAKREMVMEPTIEADKRFNIRIHEKFKQGDTIADVLHLDRKVGTRVVSVTVSSLAKNEDDIKGILVSGENVSVSIAVGKPQPKKPK